MVMPMDTITASPPAPVQRINQDANPTTSGLGGVLDAINAVAAGTSSVIAAAKEVKLNVPLVVRMKGTNEELGRQRLRESGLPIISADNLADAAEKVVKAVKEAA